MVNWKHLAHFQIWRRLPRSIRRPILLRIAALLAPTPELDPRGGGPLLVAGLLRTASGLGEGARLCYSALSQCGIEVRGIDLSALLGQENRLLDFTFVDGRDATGPGVLLLHVNSPLVPLALLQLGRRLVRQKQIIGYWAWELPQTPREWALGVPFVHEIWVPSRFTADAILPIASRRTVRIVPHPVAVRGTRRRPKRCEGARPFTVLNAFNMASGLTRKNPFAAIRAFQQAFGPDPSTRLLVHVSNADHYHEGHAELLQSVNGAANIEVMSGTLGSDELDRLYLSADVLISLHRSEGFGLHLAEAMLHGIPVLATNWSGNVDFLTAENGIPVDYKLVPAFDPQGTYNHADLLWAEADVVDAAAKLRLLREDSALRTRLGQRAAEDAMRLFSVDAYFERVNPSLKARI